MVNLVPILLIGKKKIEITEFWSLFTFKNQIIYWLLNQSGLCLAAYNRKKASNSMFLLRVKEVWQ